MANNYADPIIEEWLSVARDLVDGKVSVLGFSEQTYSTSLELDKSTGINVAHIAIGTALDVAKCAAELAGYRSDSPGHWTKHIEKILLKSDRVYTSFSGEATNVAGNLLDHALSLNLVQREEGLELFKGISARFSQRRKELGFG